MHLLAYPASPRDDLSVRVKSVVKRRKGTAGDVLVSVRLTRNGGTNEPIRVPVEFEQARSVVNVECAGSTGELIDHPLPIEGADVRGWGRVRLPADINLANNSCPLVFEDPPAARTLIVTADDASIWPARLAAGIGQEARSANAVEIVRPDRLMGIDSTGVALILWQAPLSTAKTSPLCQEVVDRGGQIIFVPARPNEKGRSCALAVAAVEQVALASSQQDFTTAVPNPRHRFWWKMTLGGASVVTLAAILAPGATLSSAQRFFTPWSNTPRFTFTRLEHLPERIVVPFGEPFEVQATLTQDSLWKPISAKLYWNREPGLNVIHQNQTYAFAMPGKVAEGKCRLVVGDLSHAITVEPMHRPEMESITAQIQLPSYLGRSEVLDRDVRGGTLAAVKGCRVSLHAKASRPTRQSWFNGHPQPTQGATFSYPDMVLEEPHPIAIRWEDEFGLTPAKPFVLQLEAALDAAPIVSCADWPRQRVMIDSETMTFTVLAQDDFGINEVGIEWKGIDKTPGISIAAGESTLGAGGCDKDRLELAGTFSPARLGIEPQLLRIRLFATDYLPNRERAYSSPFTVMVLNPEQHAVWVTEQLNQWHRAALDVRDRERELFQINRELRDLADEDLHRPETQKRIEKQAAAERDNGRRLTSLTQSGEKLVREAMKNPEIGVGHIESWAAMLLILQEIAQKRMPSVADLLKQSADLASAIKVTDRTNPAASASPLAEPADPPTKSQQKISPSAAMSESSIPPPGKDGAPSQPKKGNSNSPLRLPTVTVTGPPKATPPSPAGAKIDQALKEQEDLLAEFEKIADELNKILGNLEGSTLVKRLKAAARKQYAIAGKLTEKATAPLIRPATASPNYQSLADLAKEEEEATMTVSFIVDDLDAYLARRPFQRFKIVLDEMKKEDVVGSLRRLAGDIPKEVALSTAQGEYWSDTLDRWADNLFDPACNGDCKGQKSAKSLPPSLVLEAMRILEAEIQLREETRVAEQTKPLETSAVHADKSRKLSQTQASLAVRATELAKKIAELPAGEKEFAKELRMLASIERAMIDARNLLADANTAAPAIAAETEAIELMLRSKRINPKGAGGGGSSPGGGGTGDTEDPAMALMGVGINKEEVWQARPIPQATGQTGTPLPEEFRSGLDEYFNRLDESGGGR
ncbi:hypothetical protein K2X85_08880 [bacterium]|nr:hypothetical protein [bacterium]